jgi:hypothetical protein
VTVGSRIAGGVKTAVRAATLAAATVAETVGKRASLASRRTTDQAVAIVSGMASTAARGATAALMPKQPAVAMAAKQPAAAAAAGRTAAAGAASGGLGALGGRGAGSPLRITLPGFNAERAQRLALVATRR